MTTDFSPETASRAQVVERIIDLIVSGEQLRIPIDQRISEKDIAERLGFPSRRPIVREALALLARDGIVAQRPQWGHKVPPVSIDKARECLRFRAGAERIVVRDLASQGEGATVETLEGMLDKLREAANETDGDVFLKKDAWCRSERAGEAGFISGARTIQNWSDKLRIFRSEQNLDVIGLTFPLTELEIHEIVEGHETALEAIKKQDAEGASGTIEDQMREALWWLEEAQRATNVSSSGDLGSLEQDEEHQRVLHLLSAADAYITRGSERILTKEVERALERHPAVREAAVVATPDEKWGERPKAFVTLKEGEEASQEELREFCKENIARWKVPDVVEIVEELPKTATGKVQKFVLREKVLHDMWDRRF